MVERHRSLRGARTVPSLAACVLALALTAPTAAQSPTSPPASTAVPASGIEHGPVDAMAAYEWRRVKPARFGRAILGEVAFSPSGRTVILGYDPWQRTYARVFQSKDGRAFRSRGLPGAAPFDNKVRNVSPEAIVNAGDGFVAVGGFSDPGKGPRSRHTVIWRSDSGAKWSPSGTLRNAAPADLAAGPRGLLLAGQQIRKQGARMPAVWRSQDGAKWRRERLDSTGPPPGTVAISPDGIELVLGSKLRADGSRWTRLWRSEVRGDWRRVDLPGGLTEDASRIVSGPVATPSGFLLALREEERLVDTLWRSADGLDWARVPMPEGWSLDRSWIIVQPWPWRSLLLPARSLGGVTRQPSLLLTADGGLTGCRSEGPQQSGAYTFGAAMAPDGRLVTVGDRPFRKLSGVVWVGEPSAGLDPSTGEPTLPCQPVQLDQGSSA